MDPVTRVTDQGFLIHPLLENPAPGHRKSLFSPLCGLLFMSLLWAWLFLSHLFFFSVSLLLFSPYYKTNTDVEQKVNI